MKYLLLGNLVEETAKNHGYNVIPAFGGHGIGSYFHGPPEIYHFGNYNNIFTKDYITE